MTHRSRAMRGRILKGAAPARALPAVLLGCLLAGTLTACDSGDGGDNGGVGSPDTGTDVGAVNPDQPAGLAFSYPVDGQTDVYPGTTIAFAFNGDAAGDVQLVDTQTGNALPARVVDRGNGVFNIYPADSDARMAPATTYAVVAQGTIGDDDNTAFANGDTLFAFSTAAAGGAATSSDFTLVNFPTGSDAGFPINGESFPFTQFNTLRARFSQPVDEGSVKLCTGSESLGNDNCTVAVTGPDGSNVAGRLSVLGKDFVFDPGSINPDPSNQDADQYDGDDLEAGVQYTVNFDDDFVSASGQTLSGTDSFNVTPLSINTGDRVDVVQRLRIGVIGNDDDDNDSMSSPLTGRTANNIELASQLIGSYDLAAVPSPEQGGLQVRLAAFNGQRFGGKIPTVLPRGQKFLLQNFNLALGSQLNDDGTFSEAVVDTPVNLDNLDVQFANDSDVYLLANDLSNVETPTRVAQRLDLNIFGQVSPNSPIEALSNGVVNQTALNVLASGVAIPQDNGDISLVLYGALPISVNRDAEAAANFELELTLPASSDDQPTIMADQGAPFITAQYPTACSYVFNTLSFDSDSASFSPIFNASDVLPGLSGTTSLSANEQKCRDLMAERFIFGSGVGDDDNPTATFNFPEPRPNAVSVDTSPAFLFSEAVDPASITRVQMMNADGETISVRSRIEGSSLVVSPVERLDADTKYTVSLGGGITDLNGNPLDRSMRGGVSDTFDFNTQPLVLPRDDDGSITQLEQSDTETVRQTAPFLTTLTPGVPCALMPDTSNSADYFMDGGSQAGRCVGDDPDEAEQFAPVSSRTYSSPKLEGVQNIQSTRRVYDVFKSPSNFPVVGYFSKAVQSESVKLANGCLIGGSGNTVDGATIAIQKMSAGQCEGVVPGALAKLSPNSGLTRGFQFKPAAGFQAGQRYWVVVCGSANNLDPDNQSPASSCSSQSTVIGQSGFALNTNPLSSTGTKANVLAGGNSAFDTCPGNSPTPAPQQETNCFSDYRGGGGPDIVMPFTATAPTSDYATVLRALPEADTNGNGFFDNGNVQATAIPDGLFSFVQFPVGFNGTVTDQLTSSQGDVTTEFPDELGRERAQLPNVVYSDIFETALSAAPPVASFLGGERPIRIKPAQFGRECDEAFGLTLNNGNSVIGENTRKTCIPVELPPSGILTGTSLSFFSLVTGRLILRFPYQIDADGVATQQPQRGYIVPRCSGTITRRDSVDSDYAKPYNYAPCFVANLTVTVNADGYIDDLDNGSATRVAQQDVNIQVVGPVGFQQNGRLAISTLNTKRFIVVADATGGPTPAPTLAGEQALQLLGAPIHGGEAFPSR